MCSFLAVHHLEEEEIRSHHVCSAISIWFGLQIYLLSQWISFSHLYSKDSYPTLKVSINLPLLL